MKNKCLRWYSKERLARLKNGLLVATQYVDLPTATVGVWIGTGSRYETSQNNGVAHFLEHMAFKGTQRRTARDLELEIENLGAHLNAYTSREQTCYYAKMPFVHVSKGIEILSDIVLNPILDARLIQQEKQVILRENIEVNKNMEEVVMDKLHEQAFASTPLAFPILGSPHHISNITKQALRAFIRNNYTTDRMVVVGCGKIDHDALVQAAESLFDKIPPRGPTPVPGRFTGGTTRFSTDTDTVHMAVALQGPSSKSPDYMPLLVAQLMMGDWEHSAPLLSPLAIALSHDRLATSFASFNTSYTDVGLWGVYMAGNNPQMVDKAIVAVTREWERMCTDIDHEEVERAKQRLKYFMLAGLDDTTSIAEDVARQLLTFGKRFSVREISAQIDSITATTLQHDLRRYLLAKPAAIAIVEPRRVE